MYTGTLRLDFENDDEEAHIEGVISRCILRQNALAIEFSGADEGHRFSGSCALLRNGNNFTGPGRFTYVGRNEVSSTVFVTLQRNGTDIELNGTWTDQGDANPYELYAELLEIK